jgi:Inner membrane component of T3SS, cytoplasmic domain
MVTLRIVSGQGAGESIEVGREIVVGREGCDLTITDRELSRRHLAVRPADGGVEVEDLDSMNGTFVDGERLQGARRLDHSARLQIGGTELELEIGAPDLAVTRARGAVATLGAEQATRAHGQPAAAAAGAGVAPPPTRVTARPRAGDGRVEAEPSALQAATAGLIMGVVAGLLGVIASVAHPQPDPDDLNVVAFLETITPSSTWNLLHLLILLSVILGAAALVLLYRYYLAVGPGALVGRIAVVVLVVATAVAAVWMLLDGVAMKAIADDWAESTGAEHVADERAAVAIEHFILALFSAWLVLWQGLAYMLFGVALVRDARFPKWLGTMGIVVGTASLVLGLIQFETERDALVTHILVPLVSVFGGLWIPIAMIVWWRGVRARAAV